MSASEQIQCSKCGEMVDASDAVHSAEGKVCPACELDLESRQQGIVGKVEESLGLSGAGQAGLVLVLAAFVVQFQLNGLVVTSIAAGGLGVVFASWAVFQHIRRAEGVDPKVLAANGAVEMLAMFHIINGLGVI